MLETWQIRIESYLAIVGENPFLQALVIVLLFSIVAWLLNRVIIRLIKLVARQPSVQLEPKLVRSIHRVLFTNIMLLGLTSATVVLDFSTTTEVLIFRLLKITSILVWSAFFLTLSRSALRGMARKPDSFTWLSSQTLPLFENLANIAIVILSVYYIFSVWNIDMTAWLASAGIVGIAVGFAAKDTLANLFSGVFILADAPYKIGDYVVLDGGERGEITKIGIRSTRMVTRDDIEVTIPNSVMGNSKIINESGGPTEKSRIRVKVGVAYGSDIDIVRGILHDVAFHEEGVCMDPEPRIRMRQFGASSLDFELCCWIDHPSLRGRILDSLLCTIYKRFLKEGVEIPYSKHDVFIKEVPQNWQKPNP